MTQKYRSSSEISVQESCTVFASVSRTGAELTLERDGGTIWIGCNGIDNILSKLETNGIKKAFARQWDTIIACQKKNSPDDITNVKGLLTVSIFLPGQISAHLR